MAFSLSHEPPEHSSVNFIAHVDDGCLTTVLSLLEKRDKEQLRLASRDVRTLTNSATHKLRLTGSDIDYLCYSITCPPECSFPLALNSRFPFLEELRLVDASPCFRMSDSGRTASNASSGMGSRTGSGYLLWQAAEPCPGSPQTPQGYGLSLTHSNSQSRDLGRSGSQSRDLAQWGRATQGALDSPRSQGSGCNNGRVTDDLIEELVTCGAHSKAFERLRVLDVRGCAYLTARGLRHLLRATPMLQRFTATRWAEAASLMDCPALAHLQSLSLGDAEVDVLSVDDSSLQVVARCTSLTHLSLQRCVAITDRGLDALAPLTKLRHLVIAGTRVRGEGLARCGRPLESLDAAGAAALGDAALSALCGSALVKLRVEGTACTNAGLAALQQLPKLAHLELGSQFELTDQGLAALGACGQLNTLTFGAFNLTRAAPRGGFPALTHLQFGGSFLNRGMRFAFPLGPHVRRIVAAGFDTVTDVHVRCMARQRSLQQLELHGGYQLSDSGLQVLEGSLQSTDGASTWEPAAASVKISRAAAAAAVAAAAAAADAEALAAAAAGGAPGVEGSVLCAPALACGGPVVNTAE